MKEKGYDHTILDENGEIACSDEVEGAILKAFPKSDHIKETQLIKKLKPLLDKVTEDDVKIFNFGEGARSKIQLTQYPTICMNNRQIFDSTGLFKTMSQLDALAHCIGSSILQYLFIVRKGISLTKRSKRFIEREKVRNFRGQLHILQQDVKDLCDFLNKGIISETQFEKELCESIEDFESEDEMKIAAKIVDEMIETGEIRRSKGRLATQRSREFETKYSKLKKVK